MPFRHRSHFSLHALAATAAAVAIAFGACVAVPSTAQAAAPLVKTQAPGFYRVMVGAFEVTALSDGTVDLPIDALLHGKPGEVAARLAAARDKSPRETSVNAFLVNTGARLVLVDVGAGTLFGPTLGKLVPNLRAAGYQPEQVDDILVTHAHPDHVGGLVAQGQLAFPNATVHVAQADTAYWLSPQRMARESAQAQGLAQGAMASLNPVAAAHRLDAFAPGADLVPGIRALATPGHTPGHTSYVVESNGQRLLLIGDLIHVGSVQFDDPRVTIGFDTDEPMALATRRSVFDEAARDGTLVGAAHLSFPGLGRVFKTATGYRWAPADYTTQLK